MGWLAPCLQKIPGFLSHVARILDLRGSRRPLARTSLHARIRDDAIMQVAACFLFSEHVESRTAGAEWIGSHASSLQYLLRVPGNVLRRSAVVACLVSRHKVWFIFERLQNRDLGPGRCLCGSCG